eukprot:6751005-Alexandrium_andersonii.AAC.1
MKGHEVQTKTELGEDLPMPPAAEVAQAARAKLDADVTAGVPNDKKQRQQKIAGESVAKVGQRLKHNDKRLTALQAVCS